MAEKVTWRKATRSANGGNTCVEVARRKEEILTRDSKNPDGPRLIFDHGVWREFATQVKLGLFDL